MNAMGAQTGILNGKARRQGWSRRRVLNALLGCVLTIGWTVAFLTDRVNDPVVGAMWLIGGVVLLVDAGRGL